MQNFVQFYLNIHCIRPESKILLIFLLFRKMFIRAADEIYLNSRTFLWPHELEQVLELSGARLSVVRENLEVALR